MLTRLIAAIAIVFAMAPAAAQELEGDYLYKVTTVRAAPGGLEPLLDYIASVKASDYFEKSGEHPPFIIRHSQGDQWDLMMIEPMESWSSYHSRSSSKNAKKPVMRLLRRPKRKNR